MKKGLEELLREMHRRSLWQVLTVYLVGSWVAYQVVVSLTDGLGLPHWFPPFAVVLFLMGLPIVLTTAFLQEGIPEETTASAEGESRGRPAGVGTATDGKADTAFAGDAGRLFTWRRVLLGGVGAAALWGVVAAGWLLFGEGEGGFPASLPGTGGSVSARTDAPAGEAVAVLPFRVTGGAAEDSVLREGIADLLAINLERVTGLRKVDPRTVFSFWRRRLPDGASSPDAETALGVARDVGATYALTGSMIGQGSRVRLTAQLHDLRSGDSRGTAQVDGPADSVLALVDRLSIEILRSGLLLEAVDLPRLDLSGVTTRSMAALRAFLEGEREYRRGWWPEAIGHFEDAVAADSAFALAYFRLGSSHAWSPSGSYTLALRYLERALEMSARLPDREAMLVRGTLEHLRGEPVSIRMLQEFTRRFTDDVDGWTLLGEALRDHGPHRSSSPSRFREAYRRAIELNPYFGPPYLPLMQSAFFRRDSVALPELVRGFREIDSEIYYCVGFETAYGLLWGGPEERARAEAVADTVYADALMCAAMAMALAGRIDDTYWELIRRAEARHTPLSQGTPANHARRGYTTAGRIQELREDYLGLAGEDPVRAGLNLVFLHLTLYPDPETAARGRELVEGSPDGGGLVGRLWLGMLAAREGRREEAERLTAVLEEWARGSDVLGRLETARGPDLARAVRLYARLMADGGPEARRALAELLPELPGRGPGASAAPFLQFELARSLVDAGRYGQAEALLSAFNYTVHRELANPIRRLRGIALEGLDRPEEARRYYTRFVEEWSDADPELQEQVTSVRERLEGLAALVDTERPGR